jgi:mannobiose 2-epimerase
MHGGYFEQGKPGAKPTRLDKVWWVQAEALAGLWRLYQLTGDPTQLERLEHTLGWIEQHQRDRTYGEWHSTIATDGSADPHAHQKGSEWKASYHNVRAMVFTSTG